MRGNLVHCCYPSVYQCTFLSSSVNYATLHAPLARLARHAAEAVHEVLVALAPAGLLHAGVLVAGRHVRAAAPGVVPGGRAELHSAHRGLPRHRGHARSAQFEIVIAVAADQRPVPGPRVTLHC